MTFFNKATITFCCIIVTSSIVLAVLGIMIGFVDKATADIMQYIMKGCLGVASVATLGLVGLVLYDEYQNGQDPSCCCHAVSQDLITAEFPAPSATADITVLTASGSSSLLEMPAETVQRKKRACAIL